MKLKFRSKVKVPTGGHVNITQNGVHSVTHKVGPVTITNSPTKTRVTLRLFGGFYLTEEFRHKN